MALSRSNDPQIKRVTTVLAVACLTIFVSVVRVLYLEWRNNCLTDSLHVLVRAHVDRR